MQKTLGDFEGSLDSQNPQYVAEDIKCGMFDEQGSKKEEVVEHASRGVV